MISYTTLYLLFVISSTLLFYALLLLARYVQQTKRPPEDVDFELLVEEKQGLFAKNEQLTQELTTTQSIAKQLESDLKKLDESFKNQALELATLKSKNAGSSPALAEAPPSAS